MKIRQLPMVNTHAAKNPFHETDHPRVSKNLFHAADHSVFAHCFTFYSDRNGAGTPFSLRFAMRSNGSPRPISSKKSRGQVHNPHASKNLFHSKTT
ncbi:hypothetical protein HYV57_01390 [Candidatus Peregrinibacteria bacterium]|nr:hypothetical protein [Candidatus Peregrinibacteria bacterium]